MILQYAEVLGWPGRYLVSVESIVGQAPSIISSLGVSDMGDSETSKPMLVPFASAASHSIPQSLASPFTFWYGILNLLKILLLVS